MTLRRGRPRVEPTTLAGCTVMVLAAALAIAGSGVARAQEAPSSQDTGAAADLDAAVVRARQDLEELQESFASEADELSRQVLEAKDSLETLQEEERALARELEELNESLVDTEVKAEEAAAKATRSKDLQDALDREIVAQASGLKERFEHSFVAAEDASILERTDQLLDGATASRAEKVADLLGLYAEVLESARTVSVFRAPVRLPSGTGEVTEMNVLRVGLMGHGYFSHEGDTGFVLADADGGAGFVAETRGLSAEQKLSVDALVRDPAAGGVLPFDVTGGAGIATLQSSYGASEWFELGGVFMWPLLGLAAVALLLSLERAIVLTLKSRGIRSTARRVLELVEKGRFEEAESVCQRTGGATGAVLRAALVHREADRSVLEDAVQEALLHHTPSFQARLAFIALCAAIAPLVGLLGTVTGMISTFKMVTLFGTSDPRFMAGGISEALITTQGGLFVAIPALLLRGVLGSLAESALGKLESGALSVVLGILRIQGRDEDEPRYGVDDDSSEAPLELDVGSSTA